MVVQVACQNERSYLSPGERSVTVLSTCHRFLGRDRTSAFSAYVSAVDVGATVTFALSVPLGGDVCAFFLSRG